MKQIDVTKHVMNNVVRYERAGISVWIRSFIISIIGISIVGVYVGILIISDLLSKRAFDLFELFSQDPEIISEFWQEALTTFWEEIPQHLLYMCVFVILLLVLSILITRKKRIIIRKKLKELDKYS